jgi:pyruvate formate lyase activating enzyme
VIEWVHTEDDIREMTSYIKGAKKYYLQNYRDSITLDPSFVWGSFHENYLKKFQEIAMESVKECKIRT